MLFQDSIQFLQAYSDKVNIRNQRHAQFLIPSKMRKQCLFDSNHLIDEFGYTKHLLNCQSKLKKDWRKCKYSDSHWYLYNYIDFHEKYQCPFNPVCIQDPKKFYQVREQQIRKRKPKPQPKNSSKIQYLLSELQEDRQNASEVISFSKQSNLAINFNEISIIQVQKNLKQNGSNIPPFQSMPNHSIFEIQNALNFDDTTNQSINSLSMGGVNPTKQNMTSIISNKDQQMFEKGISRKQRQLWIQPSFQTFEKRFRQKWAANKQKENQSLKNEEEKKYEQFVEEDQEHQITIMNLQSKYDQIDF